VRKSQCAKKVPEKVWGCAVALLRSVFFLNTKGLQKADELSSYNCVSFSLLYRKR